jgi:hypothetical protein
MFVFIMDRHDNIHIVDFQHSNNKYRTLCSKIYFQKECITTLASDNTFDGICQKCKRYYDDMYASDLDEYPRIARSNVNDVNNLADYHKLEFLGPKNKYEISWERVWTKLIRARNAAKNRSGKYYGK